MAERVAKLQQPETLRDQAAWRTAALELVPGLAAAFGTATRAIVIPHEVLWRVPFEALPSETGYLADTTTIVYAPSVTALVRTPPPAAPAGSSPRLVAVAAPELAPAMLAEIARTAPDWTVRGGALAEQEANAIASGAEAGARAVARRCGGDRSGTSRAPAPGRRRSISARPFASTARARCSRRVLLAPDSANDGALEAREIMNLDLHAGVAVLSDGASMTMRDAADEVGAVGWAWRAAGVPAIVLPRWAGDDAASTTLLATLHERLRAGDAPDIALQAARAKVRAGQETSSPFYWAGWMLMGR